MQKGGDVGGSEIFAEALIQSLIGPGDSEVIEQNFQVERVGGGRCDSESRKPGLIKRFAETGEIVSDHAPALVHGQRLHAQLRPAALPGCCQRVVGPGLPRQGGGNQPQRAGEGMFRQPTEQAGVVLLIELVEGVEQQDAAHAIVLRFCSRFGQPEREVPEDIVVHCRYGLGVAGPALDSGHHAGQQPPVVGAVGGAADVVLEDEVLGMFRPPASYPVRQQGGLAAAGVTEQLKQRTAIATGMAIQRRVILGAPDISAAADFAKASCSCASRVSASGTFSLGNCALMTAVKCSSTRAASAIGSG